MGSSSYKRAAWYPILAASAATMSLVCIKTGRDAVFFNQGGLFRLPAAYIWIALASMPAAVAHLTAMKRWGARRVRVGVLISSSLIFFAFTPVTTLEYRTAMMVLFILVPVVFAAVFAATWLLAGDLLEGAGIETTAWSYAQIGAGSMLGGIAGGLLSRSLSSVLPAGFLVGTGALILLGLALLTAHVHRKYPLGGLSLEPRRKTRRESESEEPVSSQLSRASPSAEEASELGKEPYVYGLVGVSGLGALVALLIDFQFYAAVTLSGRTNAEFFAGFYTVLYLGALFFQLVVAPRLQTRVGVGGALMVLPATLLGGAIVTSYAATLVTSSVLKLTESGVKNSIHRSVWEQVFLPIGHRQREITKMVVDGMSARIAEGMGAGALYLWLSTLSVPDGNLPLTHVSQAMIAVVLAWIALTVYLYYKGCSQIGSFDPNLRLPES